MVASQGAAAIDALSQMGIAAMTGHWEFAYGPAVPRKGVQELAHPFLAANVFEKSTGRLVRWLGVC